MTTWIKKHRIEIGYMLLLIVVILNRKNDNVFLIGRLVSIAGLTALSNFLDSRYKMINTYVLAFSIYLVSSMTFGEKSNDINYLSVAVALLLYMTLTINIFLVIKDMYIQKSDIRSGRNGLKLLYVLSAFLMLIGTVITSYSHIYMNIWRVNPEAFSIANGEGFSALYFSATTYFTVGYGDITPVSGLARTVTMSQMLFGYMITCLIIPTVLIAFQRMFQLNNEREK